MDHTIDFSVAQSVLKKADQAETLTIIVKIKIVFTVLTKLNPSFGDISSSSLDSKIVLESKIVVQVVG